MENYHKYLPIRPEEELSGLCTLNAGFGTILAPSHYPSANHPSRYLFNWNNGRVLAEYQLIYITDGEGVFESQSSGLRAVKEGSVILLFPNEWHRYKPNENTGWNEYWVGFRGAIADSLVENHFFSPEKPVFQVGYRTEILDLLKLIAEKIKDAEHLEQAMISGSILQLLGQVLSLSTRQIATPQIAGHHLMEKACVLFKENMQVNLSAEEVAGRLFMSYSLFRKLFKKYTGMSPGQYQIHLKIEKAKSLLCIPNKMVKEIAYELGFDSSFYFSKLFKEKTGYSPVSYKEKYTGIASTAISR